MKINIEMLIPSPFTPFWKKQNEFHKSINSQLIRAGNVYHFVHFYAFVETLPLPFIFDEASYLAIQVNQKEIPLQTHHIRQEIAICKLYNEQQQASEMKWNVFHRRQPADHLGLKFSASNSVCLHGVQLPISNAFKKLLLPATSYK